MYVSVLSSFAGTVCLAFYASVVCVISMYTGTRPAVTVVMRESYVLYTYLYAYPQPPSVYSTGAPVKLCAQAAGLRTYVESVSLARLCARV